MTDPGEPPYSPSNETTFSVVEWFVRILLSQSPTLHVGMY